MRTPPVIRSSRNNPPDERIVSRGLTEWWAIFNQRLSSLREVSSNDHAIELKWLFFNKVQRKN
jgi:hypothetical protein